MGTAFGVNWRVVRFLKVAESFSTFSGLESLLVFILDGYLYGGTDESVTLSPVRSCLRDGNEMYRRPHEVPSGVHALSRFHQIISLMQRFVSCSGEILQH